ncbi:Mn2+/Fe2+ NRAMP family transporter [Clostridium beijerinckii]|nr:Mn2+/Fe2+ NRAMP family transporter [Clostridium beijerinckii]NRW44465.1 Mn2+/Fe2+ NRAMP family transporter [Clostridium beijerinckii]
MDNDYKDAPAFFGIYTGIIVLGALFILLPGISLIQIILVSQQIAGLLSPIILTFMIILINDKRIMGEYVNNKTQNIVSWATVIFIIILSIILFVSPLIS